jgi:putative thioredoxin
MQPLLNATAGHTDAIKDGSTAGFKADVIDASFEVPVIVDFWATWCGPCKQLGPALEGAVRGAGGKVRLVKIDVDQNQQLAQQMRVQSIPMVVAFFEGRPVDYFQGALPESQVKQFVDKLADLGGGPESALDEALGQAKALEESGEHSSAGGIYAQILQHEPTSAAAIAGLARNLIALGQPDRARQVIDGAPEEAAGHQELAAVRTQLELAEQTAEAAGELPALESSVKLDPDNHQARYDLAMALYGAGQREAAVDHLLEIIRRDRDWNEQAARKQLLKLFEAFGPTDKLTISARRRLSSMLFA